LRASDFASLFPKNWVFDSANGVCSRPVSPIFVTASRTKR
jgi:hypothetical protein